MLIKFGHAFRSMKLSLLLMPTMILVVAAVFSTANIVTAQATTTTFCMASLDGSQEVPSVDTDGSGSATLEFDPSNNELSWSIEFSNLTGPPSMAHFHGPAESGTNAGVQVNIGDISGLDSPMEGTAELTSEQATMLLDEELYINIHTEENPDGEIRGQVSCEDVPDDGDSDNTATVVIGDEEFVIEYSITGGTVDELSADPEINTLTINMTSNSDGNLTLWLPTDAIDAEEEFAVFIDEEYGSFVVDELEPTDDARGLMIEFPMGADVIEIVGDSMAGSDSEVPQMVTVEIDGQEYDIQFEASGGSVQTATADVDSKTIVFAILSNSSGMLTLWLPTTLIDSDQDFTVFVDGVEANYTELARVGNARVLQIPFSQGAEEVSVSGTSIVPEFGALVVVAASLVTGGAIVASRRFFKLGG